MQQILGWGQSYISQLLGKQKSLRVDQVLSILAALGVPPVGFFGELYGWPDRFTTTAMQREPVPLHRAAIEAEVGRQVTGVLRLLRGKITESDLTQTAIQDRLGWGRSYISQLFSRAKGLRVDQVLRILGVLGIEAKDFYAELYMPQLVAESRARELKLLWAQHRTLVRLLEAKGILTAEEVAEVAGALQVTDSEA